MLEAIALSKAYDDGPRALDGVSLRVAPGELFCLVGGNGAGKTTALGCFLDFITPSSGRAEVDGIHVAANPIEAKRHVSYVPENVMLYGTLTARQNLTFFSRLGKMGSDLSSRELAAALGEVGLSAHVLDRRVQELSKGMRQKLGLAIALLRGARNLILDEPTSGLDPQSGADFMSVLLSLRNAGSAILMSTHDLFRAKQHADQLGIMREGRLCTTLHRPSIAIADVDQLYSAVMQGAVVRHA